MRLAGDVRDEGEACVGDGQGRRRAPGLGASRLRACVTVGSKARMLGISGAEGVGPAIPPTGCGGVWAVVVHAHGVGTARATDCGAVGPPFRGFRPEQIAL